MAQWQTTSGKVLGQQKTDKFWRHVEMLTFSMEIMEKTNKWKQKAEEQKKSNLQFLKMSTAEIHEKSIKISQIKRCYSKHSLQEGLCYYNLITSIASV